MKPAVPSMTVEDALLFAKLAGACAGSAISLAYILPKGKREAAIRFLVGVTAGMVFGAPIGIWIAHRFGIHGDILEVELAMMGAAFASLTIWSALGIAQRMSETGLIPKVPAKKTTTKPEAKLDDKTNA